MKEPDSTEKHDLPACPFLPPANPGLSYRDLRRAAETGPPALFATAHSYAAELFRRGQPARAILALCRAIYLDPERLDPGSRQPYAAYRWILEHAHLGGFLGNPRVSFHHQATRIRKESQIRRMRSWALWHITRSTLPHLPPDSRQNEDPPSVHEVAVCLDRRGLQSEGGDFLQALANGSGTGA